MDALLVALIGLVLVSVGLATVVARVEAGR